MVAELRAELKGLAWVEDAEMRLREEGQLLFGEAFVISKEEKGLIDKLSEANRTLQNVHWRVYDIVVVPVRTLSGGEGEGQA